MCVCACALVCVYTCHLSPPRFSIQPLNWSSNYFFNIKRVKVIFKQVLCWISFINSFTTIRFTIWQGNSFIQELFPKYLIYARHCAKDTTVYKTWSLPLGTLHPSTKETTNKRSQSGDDFFENNIIVMQLADFWSDLYFWKGILERFLWRD